jgi:hypothetical protein
MIFFIYQVYITANRVQIVQKYLKTEVINKLMNRYEVTAEQRTSTNTNRKTPTDGQYFYIYNEFAAGSATPGMNAGLDKATAGILLTFMTSGDRSGLEARLTDGYPSRQAMGLCIGGRKVMNEQVDTNVFNMVDGDTCKK